MSRHIQRLSSFLINCSIEFHHNLLSCSCSQNQQDPSLIFPNPTHFLPCLCLIQPSLGSLHGIIHCCDHPKYANTNINHFLPPTFRTSPIMQQRRVNKHQRDATINITRQKRHYSPWKVKVPC